MGPDPAFAGSVIKKLSRTERERLNVYQWLASSGNAIIQLLTDILSSRIGSKLDILARYGRLPAVRNGLAIALPQPFP